MTKIGEFLARRSISKTLVSKRSGITKQRINDLTLKDSARLTADELYLISLAIDIDPCELLKALFVDLKLIK